MLTPQTPADGTTRSIRAHAFAKKAASRRALEYVARVNESSTRARARVLIGAAEVELRDKLQTILERWTEFEIVDVCSDLGSLLEPSRRGSADLAIVDAMICRHGISSDVEAIASLGLPVVVFTGRGSYPSVVELAGRIAVRAITLPRWVLDQEDELTAAHTRALLLDLTGQTMRWSTTGEFESPAELDHVELRSNHH